MQLEWITEPGRTVGKCGNLAVGAVYPGVRRIRWRAWVTKNMNPVESTAINESKAKLEVELRFDEFLQLANLQPVRKP